MEAEKKCCDKKPIVWRCDCGSSSFCGCDVEKIECAICNRIVWGSDDESVARWNNGENDEPDLIKSGY